MPPERPEKIGHAVKEVNGKIMITTICSRGENYDEVQT
jgi:hypothetical protein